MPQLSLWGDDFTVKEEDISRLVKKIKQPRKKTELSTEKAIKSKSVPIAEKMELIKADVYKTLGSYVNDTICIRDYNELVKYFDKAVENGIIAVDTETNNTLDTIDCELMGLCIYTPGMKNAYVPVSHRHFTIDENNKVVLGDLLENQLKCDQIKTQLQRLLNNNVKELYHNAAFDIGVLMSTCDIRLKAYWDSSLGAKVLNELENKNLKEQYKIHINPDQEKYNIEKLFKGLPYAIFDPDLFALYAATDSFMTLKLYEYQLEQFKLHGNEDIYNLFINVEMPCIDAVVDMQQYGVEVDLPYAKKMSVEYHKRLDIAEKNISDELNRLKPLIDDWKLTPEANAKKRVYPAKKTKMSEEDIAKKFTLIDEKGKRYKMSTKTPVEQLSDPLDVGSPTQLQILLYDILKVPSVSKEDPKGTGAEILEELSYDYKICKLILAKRDVEILINTFIDKIPTLVKKRTGRVHAKFNQYGADTGRFSSGEKDPDNPKVKTLNLQNIPSHDKCIRMIFKAPEGETIIGADYSAQEIRVLASMANDKGMIDAYAAKKDLYAEIGAMAFKCDYEDCLEFDPRKDGMLNPEGKARRSKAKTLLLGLNYGMTTKKLAGRIDSSVEEAELMKTNFYAGFSGVDKFTKASQAMLKEKGYVTDVYGRRRHIPDAQLPDYTIKLAKQVNRDFNPLIGSVPHEDKALQAKMDQYESKLKACKWKKEKDAIIASAKQEGFIIRNNMSFINRSMRQCLNARIQGSSASITKRAMGMIHNDSELNELGFKLLVTVHDEVFGSVKKENSALAAKRLSEIMVSAAQEKCSNVAWKCDAYEVSAWYEDEATGNIKEGYDKLIKNGLSQDDALLATMKQYPMFTADGIKLVCDGNYRVNTDDIKILKGE